MTDLLPRITAALADRYAVERQIGQGGMATVFLAEDLKHGRKVAVKVLKPELAVALGGGRFTREIQIAARLQHPHILPLLDSGEAGGFLYYVMPFVEGQSLRERLTRTGELPVHDAVKILVEVVDALAHAHEHGVVHRDIKPDNVMLSGRHALVTDFGVAKAVSEATGRQQMTTAGVAMGTPAYMAPEQAAADPNLDHRVDIYAVGCVAYELLTGGPPFDRMSPQETLAAHVTQAPEPVDRRRQAVPPALATVIMTCLAKRPADRWQSAEELLAQLEPLATPSGGTTPTQTRPIDAVAGATPPWRRRGVLAGAVALLAVVLAAMQLMRPSVPDITLGRRTQATLLPGLEIFPALSPDGSFLAYIGEGYRLFVRQVDGGTAIPVARDVRGPLAAPFWSPDGKFISFSSPRGVEVVPALGGVPRLLLPVANSQLIFGFGWNRSGSEVAAWRNDTLFAVTSEQGSVRVLATGELHSCVWSPGGIWIACVLGNLPALVPGRSLANLAQSEIVLLPSRGGALSLVTQDSASNASPAWLPDGTLLYSSSREGGRDIYAVRVNSSGRRASEPRRVTTGLNALSLTTSASGSRIAYAAFTDASNIWSMPVPPPGTVGSVTQATPHTSGNQVIELFDVSPDGRWIAFDSDRSGNSDIYRMPLPMGDIEQLTRSPRNEFAPSWSPDGRELAFHGFQTGIRQVYTIPAAGGPVTPVARSGEHTQNVTWSNDGKSLYFLYNSQSAVASETRRVTRTADGGWGTPSTWRRPACGRDEAPVGDVVVCGLGIVSGGALLTTRAGDSIRTLVNTAQVVLLSTKGGWLADGRTYYFMGADPGGTASVYAVSVAAGDPRVVVRFDDPARQWHRFGFEMQGGRFYFTLGDQQSDVWVAELNAGS